MKNPTVNRKNRDKFDRTFWRRSTALVFATCLATLSFGGCKMALQADKASVAAVSASSTLKEPVWIAISIPESGTFINSTNDVSSFALSGTCLLERGIVRAYVNEAPAPQSQPTTCKGGVWAMTFNSLMLPVDTHQLNVTLSPAGSMSNTPTPFPSAVSADPVLALAQSQVHVSTSVILIKSVNTPTVAITAPLTSSYISAASDSASFQFSGSCSEANHRVSIEINGVAVDGLLGGNCEGAAWSAKLSTLDLADGAHSFVAKIQDGTGNPGVSSAITVTKDTQSPSVSISAPVANSYITAVSNTASFVVTGTCSDASQSVVIQIDSQVAAGMSGGVCNGTTFSATVNTMALSLGSHIFTAVHTDAAGNPRTSGAVNVIKDIRVPTVAIAAPLNGSYFNIANDSASFAVTGTCSETSENVSLKVDGSPAPSQTGGFCDGSIWSGTFSSSALLEGTHTLSASITSLAGNTGASTLPAVIIRDVTAPTLAVLTPGAGSYIGAANNSASFAITGACSENTKSVTIKVDGANSGSGATCAGLAFSGTIDSTALSTAAHTITAIHVDAAANAITSSAITITKDLTFMPGATFTRASTAYNSYSGVLAATNVARYSSVSLSTGLMVEESTSNILPINSGNFASSWSTYSGAVVTITAGQTDPFAGTGAYRVQSSGGTSMTKYYSTSVCPGVNLTKYATQIWIKANSATNVIISDNMATATSFTQAQGWQLYKAIGTGNGGGCIQVVLMAPTVGENLDCMVMNPMQEVKSYVSSYIPPGTTRAVETMTLPAAGIIQASQGAMIARVFIDGDSKASTVAMTHMIFDSGSTNSQNRIQLYQEVGTPGIWRARIYDAASTVTAASWSQTLSIGWHIVAVSWNSAKLAVWVDGALRASNTSVSLPTALGSTLFVGSNRTNTEQWDQSIGYTAFYQTTPSDAAMTTYTTSGPVNADYTMNFSQGAGVLAITTPSNAGYINAASDSASFNLAGTCSLNGRTVVIKVDGVTATGLSGGACNGTSWSATINTGGLTAASHAITAIISDTGGVIYTSNVVNVTRDVTAPALAITAPANASYINIANSTSTFAVSGTCNDSSATFAVKVDGANATSQVGNSCGGASWSSTISVTGLAQGSHTLAAAITDPAGNSTSSGSITLSKDTVAPTVAVVTPTTGSYVNIATDSTSFALTGTCSENTLAVTVKVDGAVSGAGGTCSTGSWNAAINSTALSAATHTLTSVVGDAAGNSTTSGAVTFTRDVTRPTVTFNYPITNFYINPNTNSASYSVNGTCSDNALPVAILVDGVSASGLASNTCASSTFAATIDTVGLSDAAHTITATQTDVAGNIGPSGPASVAVTKDTTSTMGGTFTRTSSAYDPYTAVLSAAGVARFPSVGGATGMMIEEGTTNLLANPQFGTVGAPSLASWQVVDWDTNVAGNTASAVTVVGPMGTTIPVARLYRAPGSIDTNMIGMMHGLSSGTASTRFWMKLDSGTSGISVYTGAGWVSAGTATTSWQEFKVQNHAVGGASGPTFRIKPEMGTGVVALIAYPQIEQKSYSTSWMDGTRSAEVLTVPTAGSLQASQGAIVFRTYFAGDIAAATALGTHFLFDSVPSGSSRLTLQVNNASPPQISSNSFNASGQNSQVNWSQQLSVGWHYIALRWSATRLSLWVDGLERNAATNPYLPAAFNTTAAIGSIYHGGSGHWDQPVDHASFYQYAPTDAQMTTFTSTGPTVADNRLDFNGAVFSRSSTAQDFTTGAQVALNTARYKTVSGKTGVVTEEATTNLLTANQSNVETDTTGFSSNGTASFSRITSWKWEGNASVRIQGATNISTSAILMSGVSFTTGSVYAVSFYGYNPNGSAITLTSGIGGYLTSTQTLQPAETKRVTYTWTSDFTGISQLRFIESTGQPLYLDGLQIEQKTWASSWQIGGTPRVSEALDIPLKGILPTSDWTVELAWIPQQPATGIVDQGTSPMIFQIGDYYSNSSVVLWNFVSTISPGAEPRLLFYVKGQSNAGWSIGGTTIKASGTGWFSVNSLRRIAVRCTGNDTFHVFYEGTKFAHPSASPPRRWRSTRASGLLAARLTTGWRFGMPAS